MASGLEVGAAGGAGGEVNTYVRRWWAAGVGLVFGYALWAWACVRVMLSDCGRKDVWGGGEYTGIKQRRST